MESSKLEADTLKKKILVIILHRAKAQDREGFLFLGGGWVVKIRSLSNEDN